MEHTTESDGKKRTYHSRVRQRQAEETRRRILEAARSLFESRGYTATTLDAIAEIAEVSPKTLGAVFGSKRALLAEVINPDAFSTPVQQLIEELRTTEDPSRRLSLVAQITRQAYEPRARSLELLRTAGAVAPELADLAQQVEARRRQNQARLTVFLREQGALTPFLSFEEATGVLWALTSYDLYRMLVVEQRWEPERYETWLAQLLVQHLLSSR
ncbi:MAG TPA: helix-turn-helix domain-containing protein [Ktedonobacteraceae bacterium]|nr:helix-turn-helix domain-containing protein [Ktedonobacteraceae bacterium]